MATYGNQIAQPSVAYASASVAGVVDLVYLTNPGMGVKVTNVSGTAPIWFTVSHPGGDCPIPVGGGTGCYSVASVAGTSTTVRHDGQFGTVVQLISSGTPAYAVEVQSVHATS